MEREYRRGRRGRREMDKGGMRGERKKETVGTYSFYWTAFASGYLIRSKSFVDTVCTVSRPGCTWAVILSAFVIS